MNKRDRSVNFSWEETNLLVHLVGKRANIVENKKSGAVTWHEKEAAWNSIEAEFNSTSRGIFRNAKNLKVKYEALKRDTRRKTAQIYTNGGGINAASPLTSIEEKVKNILFFSVKQENIGDSDQTSFSETEQTLTTSTSSFEFVPVSEENGINTNQEPDKILDNSHKNGVNLETQKPEEPKLSSSFTDSKNPAEATVVEESVEEPTETEDEWKTTPFKSKKQHTTSKLKERRPYEKLAQLKIETALMQKKILEEEYKHKKIIRNLEKQKLLLEIEVLKKQLENKK